MSGRRPWRLWGNSEPYAASLFPLGSFGSAEAADKAARSYIEETGRKLLAFSVVMVENVDTGARYHLRRKVEGARPRVVEVEVYQPPKVTRVR